MPALPVVAEDVVVPHPSQEEMTSHGR